MGFISELSKVGQEDDRPTGGGYGPGVSGGMMRGGNEYGSNLGGIGDPFSASQPGAVPGGALGGQGGGRAHALVVDLLVLGLRLSQLTSVQRGGVGWRTRQ